MPTLDFKPSGSTYTVGTSTLLLQLPWLVVEQLEQRRRDGVCQLKQREVRVATVVISVPALIVKAQTHRGISQPNSLRRNSRIASVKNCSQERRRSLRLQGADPIPTTPNSIQQAKKPKRSREEDEVSPSHPSLEPLPKRVRTSVDEPVNWKTISDVRISYWRETGTWPTEEQGAVMDRFRDLVNHALPKERSKSSLRRKHSDASINAETVPTRTPSDQQQREQKSAPYRHPRYEGQLQERGSFMDDHEEGISTQSEKLCQKLLQTPRKPPEHTLFSDDNPFKKTCRRLRGGSETKVIRDIAQLIVPSAEILADYGARHLEILRETTNAGWINAIPFCGPRPQPDFGLGFKREAFSREQLQKLQPFIGNELQDCSYIAATYNIYLPFLTSEVKCGASALDVADRQNLHSQTISLRNLIELFRLVGRLDELHREINGYSISHSDEYVRIWAHYIVVEKQDFTFHRHPVSKFDISPTAEGDQRWKAWTIVMNILEFWVPDHFKNVCSAIDMLPADFNLEVSDLCEAQTAHQGGNSSHSGLSQQLEEYNLVGQPLMMDSQVSTPATTVQSVSSNSKKKKAYEDAMRTASGKADAWWGEWEGRAKTLQQEIEEAGH